MPDFDRIARANPDYVESLYRDYKRDPASVDEEWRLVFAGYEFARGEGVAPAPPGVEPVLGVFDLVHTYRELGHLIARLDPLGHNPRTHPLLQLSEFGFDEEDLDRVVSCGSFRGLDRAPLRDLVEALRQTYCGTFAVEFLNISDKEKRDWLEDRMEPARNRADLTPDYRRIILRKLLAAEGFEQFLGARYVGQKRFSIEGGEALVPLLDATVEDAANSGVREMVVGMPHRGRLNVLAHLLNKPLEMTLAEFEGTMLPSDIPGDGDVKYHLGYSHDHTTRNGHRIHLSLSYNPSHLESINPVVEGIVRAKQSYLGDASRSRVVPVLLHGDAAFVGQGLVYETLALSQLEGFTTGGTIHVIVDNQVGFTTDPVDYVFTNYPSDLARVIEAPVFHVNADDPEAAIQAARLAVAYRQAFHTDVFVHFICYRRYGHNELDDPTLTQPRMYAEIAEHPTTATLYARRLVDEEVVTEDEVEAWKEDIRSVLSDARDYARQFKPRQQVFALGGVWKGLGWAGDDWSADTRVDESILRELGTRLWTLPEGFEPNRRLSRLLDSRREMIDKGEGLDWGCAETLAYASLLREGIPVRLTGQDSIRGTFAHRHAILFDARTGEAHTPLNAVASDQAEIELVNSPLSEAGVLGFEYGMSSADPRRLMIWEAQFGDFANGAQVIIDQFLASGESKWQRMSGLVLLLPHGYEGQGPEHSSARLERFLQLGAEDNIQVVNATTPAQLFHVLRRQMHRSFRKPLVVMSPKSLLRHPEAVSTLAELAEGRFENVLDDPDPPETTTIERVLVCSGKIFYALSKARAETEECPPTAVVRLEQLYPFPREELARVLGRYERTGDVCWVQEEPANMGAWSFVRSRLRELLREHQALRYVGREEAASPATGSYALHQQEEQALLEEAFRPARRSELHEGAEATQRATA